MQRARPSRPDDPAALARAIDELLSDAALATRLGTQARERARAYEWSELANRILELYRAAVDNRLQPTTTSA